MKPFSIAPKFNQVLTVCALGVTLIGLPMTTMAQDATNNSPSLDSTSVEALHSSHRKIYVNQTKWLVEYAKNGRNGDYHPVPWVFSPDGTVRAGKLWRGIWQVKSHDTVTVGIRMNDNSATDYFDVQFKSPLEFVAYKHGYAYRYAVRK